MISLNQDAKREDVGSFYSSSHFKLLYQASVSTIQSPDARKSSQQISKPQQEWHHYTMDDYEMEHSNDYENKKENDCSDMYVNEPISGDIFGSQGNKMEKLPLRQTMASCMCLFQFVFLIF